MSKYNDDVLNQLQAKDAKALKKAAKKAAKKAKKEYEQKLKALEELGNAHREAVVLDPAIMEAVDKLPARKPVQSEPPKMRQWTDEENKQFAMRIQNEKRNIWRICKQDPQEIIKFCEENVRDERNAAIRFARRDAMQWAKAQQPMPY